jgi:hypothetical protein
MTIASPVILLPTNGTNYTTDIENQTLSGTTSTDTKEITVNGSTFGVSYTPGEVAWAWNGTLILGTNTYSIIAIEKTTLNPSLPTTITITLVENETFVTVSAPTGVRVREYQDKMEIVNSQNPELQTIGYNYYVSTQSGGIDGSYVKINDKLVDNKFPTFSETNTKVLNSVTDTAGNIRVTTTTEEIDVVKYYSAFFDKTLFTDMIVTGLLPGVTWSEDTPFFFVVTAVIYDSVLGQVSESTNSAELQGSPLIITTGIRTLPTRSQSDIILTVSQELLTADQGIDVKPGTVLRDQVDPITEEMARLYVIQDFMSRSLSVSSLLDFDDANGDGISDPVTSSVPKTALQVALNITNPPDVQTLIDAQFDKLASNVNIIRRGSIPAVGTAVFYIETQPIRDMAVNQGAIITSPGNLDQGIPSENYQVLISKILDFATRDKFYNSQTHRYELECDVQAVSAGSQGNTDSYTINTITSGADSDFRVENPNPIEFGQDVESNHDLAGRLELALFADTGTGGGYMKTALAVQSVHNVQVQKAMDPLMIRDYDPVRQTHVGGKVDIYIQGTRIKQVTDQIAFSFESIAQTQGGQTGEIFLVLNAASFQFKSTNPRVTAHTPIFDVTRVHNATRNADYDITGYQIIGDGDTIDLDELKPTNVVIGLASTDVVRVDYKFRSSDTFILKSQPVNEIISVIGQLSGELTSDNWELVKLQDPLNDGGSTISSDSIRIKFANNLPVTGFQTITDEPHVLILEKQEPLNYIGADPESILVKNQDKTVTYTENIDYRVIIGTDTVPTAILMIETGAISNGEAVLISYTAIENFTITYSTNDLLNTVQTQINTMKHACADAIVKNAIENKVDFAFTVVAKSGVTNTSNLIAQMRTAVSNYITQLDVGMSLTQSEVIHILQIIPDVDYVIVPLTRMVKADGSFIVRDNVGRTQFQLFNSGLSVSYISSVSVLTYKTVDQGGPENLFKGIFENKQPLVLQTDPLNVSGGPGRGYIRSDGKIIVSTKDGQLPDTKNYDVAYYVYGETGSDDINVAQIEYLTVGSFTPNVDQPAN